MKKRLLVTIAILAVTAGATLEFETVAHSVARHSYAKRIPLRLGDWKGVDMPISQSTIDNLGTSDLLMREYVNSNGDRIIFAAVFAQDDRRAAHAPEICYRGQGWMIVKQQQVSYPVQPPEAGYIPPADDPAPEQNHTQKLELDAESAGEPDELPQTLELAPPIDFNLTELFIRQGGERRLVHYYYKSGSKATNNLLLHEWHMLCNNIIARSSSNSLLRISTGVPGNSAEDIQAARARVKDFSQTVYPYIIAAMP